MTDYLHGSGETLRSVHHEASECTELDKVPFNQISVRNNVRSRPTSKVQFSFCGIYFTSEVDQ